MNARNPPPGAVLRVGPAPPLAHIARFVIRRRSIPSAARPASLAATAARAAYLLLILGATLTGLRLELDFAWAARQLGAALNPTVVPRDVVDAARNLALFAGWGAVWMITAPGRELRRSLVHATLTGAAISVVVESVQLFSPVRDASILDVLTNSAGAFAGALAVLALAVTLAGLRGRRSFVGVPAVLFAGAYGSAVMLEALMPLFRQQRVPGAWGGPGSRLALALEYARAEPFAQFPLLDVLLFLPAGFLLVAAVVEMGVRYRVAALVITATAPLVLAVIQLARALMGYPIEPGALLTQSVAIAAGALLAAAAIPPLTTKLRGRHRPLALLVVYVLLMVLWSWRPFVLEYNLDVIAVQLNVQRLIPLRSLYDQVTMFSVAVVGVQLLLFVPLGGLLAVWPLRTSGALAHLLPAIYLAAVLELGQFFVAGPYFDITELLLRVSGAAVAWLLVRRSGYPVYGELLVRRR